MAECPVATSGGFRRGFPLISFGTPQTYARRPNEPPPVAIRRALNVVIRCGRRLASGASGEGGCIGFATKPDGEFMLKFEADPDSVLVCAFNPR